MKIYYWDFGVYGCTTVVAESKEEAIEQAQSSSRFLDPDNCQVFDIKPGLVIVNLGDT